LKLQHLPLHDSSNNSHNYKAAVMAIETAVEWDDALQPCGHNYKAAVMAIETLTKTCVVGGKWSSQLQSRCDGD